MASTRETTRADSQEKLLQPEIQPPTTPTPKPTTTSSNSGYFSDTEGERGSAGNSSNSASAPASAPPGVATLQTRNRIPLGLCVQQTAISTPSASISVDEPPIMISTEDDTDNVHVLLWGKNASFERSGNSFDSSSHTVHDVEMTLGSASASHSVHSSNAVMGGCSGGDGGGRGGVHYERGGSFPGNPHLHDPSCKHRLVAFDWFIYRFLIFSQLKRKFK